MTELKTFEREVKQMLEDMPYSALEIGNAYRCLSCLGVDREQLGRHELEVLEAILLVPDIRAGIYHTNAAILGVGEALKEAIL